MQRTSVRVGHIFLAKSFDGTDEHFVNLLEALMRAGLQQYVLVRNPSLAKRYDAIEGVDVGPTVRSAVAASCLMPHLDLVHAHDRAAGQAGLLLTLTRSIPFVLTHRESMAINKDPITQAVYKRAAGIICVDDADIALLRHYDQSLRLHLVQDPGRFDSTRDHLRIYQNSQRMPIAGSKGIQ
ncbi:MAG: glycosyltransferase [Gammaproteobacteria bacterium]|nr:glycosyltransferase [Gammaproteobacteria bacterium]